MTALYACSIYTVELQAILLTLKHVYCSRGRTFVILSDSLSSLQAIFNLKYDHPFLVQIFGTLYESDQRWEEDCDLSQFPAKWALEVIQLQILLLRMPSLVTSQKRRDCDSPIAHWPLFYYSFIFIDG